MEEGEDECVYGNVFVISSSPGGSGGSGGFSLWLAACFVITEPHYSVHNYIRNDILRQVCVCVCDPLQ